MAATRINHPAFRAASLAVLALVALGALFLAAEARWLEALALAGLIALGIGFIAAEDRLPTVFDLLFVLAAAANMAGYVFTLWDDPVWFDEVVHAYTGFAGSAAIGWLLVRATRIEETRYGLRLIAVVTAIGIALGILWEIFEWAIGIIGTPLDTRRDLVMDSVGALAAGFWCAWVAGRLKDDGGRP